MTGAGWGYAYAGQYVCSYHCMRQAKREDEENMTNEEKKRVDELLAEGKTKAETARIAGVNAQQVYDYTSREKKNGQKTKRIPAPEEQIEVVTRMPEKEGKYGLNERMLALGVIRDMMSVIVRMYE